MIVILTWTLASSSFPAPPVIMIYALLLGWLLVQCVAVLYKRRKVRLILFNASIE